MFKTIAAALTALKPGQVIKLLDKGPYREDLNKVLPEDVGLISEVGTRIEVPRWNKHYQLHQGNFYRGNYLEITGGARLAGLETHRPQAGIRQLLYGLADDQHPQG